MKGPAKGSKAPLSDAGDQARTKALLIADEWKRSGLDAMAVGATDWTLGRPVIQQLMADGLPLLAANLVCEAGARPLPAARVISRAGRRIGVVAVTEGPVPGCVVTEPVQAIREAVALWENEPVDATVLLWPTRNDDAHKAALAGLPVDFILDASGRYSQPDNIQTAGDSWLIGAGGETKAFGVVELSFTEPGPFFPKGYGATLPKRKAELEKRLETVVEKLADKPHPNYSRQRDSLMVDIEQLGRRQVAFEAGEANEFALTLYKLGDEVPDDPDTRARVDAAKATFAQALDASPSEIMARPLVAPAGGAYAGAAACLDCHPTQSAQWRKTPHASAYTALLKTLNHMDEACFQCHVTGAFEEKPVFDTPQDVAGLIHVQCEACHGPSAAHVADPASSKPVRMPEEATCTACHDGKRDEGKFDLKTYLPQVSHGAE